MSTVTANKGPHISGWRKEKLIRELARGQKTTERLARDFNVAVQTIYNFKSRHAEEIQEILDGFTEEYGDVWFAQQYNRVLFLASLIEEYEDQKQALTTEAEYATEQMRAIDPAAAEVYPPRKEWDMLCRSQAMYAKQLAEELGQLKQRAPASDAANTMKVIHEMGVDMSRAFPAKEPA